MEKSENIDVSYDTEDGTSDIFSLLANLSDSSNSQTSPSLLSSLKPYLSQKRQKKLEQCEKILTLSNTLKLLNDLHIFDELNEDS